MSTAVNAAEQIRLNQAADWLQRLEEAPRDAGTLSRWLEWCQADVRNLEAFESLQSVWAAFDEPEVQTAARRLRAPGRRSSLRSMAMAASVTVAIALGFAVVNRDVLLDWLDPAREVLTTEVAEHGNQLLADGSRVELGGKTRIVTRYTERERSVVVASGEAFFAVTKDRQRPFVVRAGGVTVTAVGTAFSVRRTMDRTVVAVSEGVVRVAPGAAHQVQLTAGEQVSYSAANNSLNIVRIDPKVAESRLDGQLSFESEPLRSVIADVNRYASRRIVIDDAVLGDRIFTGTVYEDRIQDWLRALETVFPLTVVDQGDSIELVPREGQASID